MSLYVDRIEVHLSSQATNKNVNTTFITDGQIVDQGNFDTDNGSVWTQGLAQMSLPGSRTAAATGNLRPNGSQNPDASFPSPAQIHLPTTSGFSSVTSSSDSTTTRPSRTSSNLSPTTPRSISSSLYGDSDPFTSCSWMNFTQLPNDQLGTAASGWPQEDNQLESGFMLPHSDSFTVGASLNGDISMLDPGSCPDSSFSSSQPPFPEFNKVRSAPLDSTESTSVSRTTTSESAPITTSLTTTTSLDETSSTRGHLPAKRMKKLATMLESMQAAPMPSLKEHNDTIRELMNQKDLQLEHLKNMSCPQFAGILEKHCDASTAAGFIFGLLSWEVFRKEEERLALEENPSPITASKAVNKQMADTLQRRAKSCDWASDRRKAAKMIFETLRTRTPVERSFALLLLARTVSLDGLLKIAHFPATRESFCSQFANIVGNMAMRWDDLARSGFMAFDFNEFLKHRRTSEVIPHPTRLEESLPLDDMVSRSLTISLPKLHSPQKIQWSDQIFMGANPEQVIKHGIPLDLDIFA